MILDNFFSIYVVFKAISFDLLPSCWIICLNCYLHRTIILYLMGPRGACSLCSPNECPAEPLLHLNLSRLCSDVCTNS
jgi:hypothetical protein